MTSRDFLQPSIVILTGSHLCHNPRAFKEAETLAAAGFEVRVLGGWLSPELAERDRALLARKAWTFTPVIDWTESNRRASLGRQQQRFRRWFGSKQFQLFGWEGSSQLGYCTRELLEEALRQDPDLFIAHSEPALWVAWKLAKRGFRVGVDLEDWFSEDLLPEARRERPVRLIRKLEQDLLRRAAYASCPSHAMSDALAKEFGCRPPAVMYNAFPWADRQGLDGLVKDRVNRSVPSVHWYSQTIGEGRGLEDLFAALPLLTRETEIHLRGTPTTGFHDWMNARVPEAWRKRIFIHPLVSNAELLSRIAEHDVGFAGELKYCRNRELTVTNKILHYLLAGLAVVASDTVGQREVAEQACSAVWLYPSGEPQKLAGQLNRLLGMPDHLQAAKAGALRVAEKKFCWEKISPELVRRVEDALAQRDVSKTND